MINFLIDNLVPCTSDLLDSLFFLLRSCLADGDLSLVELCSDDLGFVDFFAGFLPPELALSLLDSTVKLLGFEASVGLV